jgi:putative tricarboxylic transport membrane protein
MTALLGGHIELVASSAAPAIGHYQQGRSRIVAISGPKRMTGALAQVPTRKEQGIAAINSNWRALVGARGLSAAQVAYWEDVAARLTKTEEWKKELDANAWESHLLRGRPLRDFLEAEAKEAKEILTELGLAK